MAKVQKKALPKKAKTKTTPGSAGKPAPTTAKALKKTAPKKGKAAESASKPLAGLKKGRNKAVPKVSPKKASAKTTRQPKRVAPKSAPAKRSGTRRALAMTAVGLTYGLTPLGRTGDMKTLLPDERAVVVVLRAHDPNRCTLETIASESGLSSNRVQIALDVLKLEPAWVN